MLVFLLDKNCLWHHSKHYLQLGELSGGWVGRGARVLGNLGEAKLVGLVGLLFLNHPLFTLAESISSSLKWDNIFFEVG